jgi:hypothetical protein
MRSVHPGGSIGPLPIALQSVRTLRPIPKATNRPIATPAGSTRRSGKNNAKSTVEVGCFPEREYKRTKRAAAIPPIINRASLGDAVKRFVNP